MIDLLPLTPAIAERTRPIYERVSRVITAAEWDLFAPYVDAINRLKRERNAVILAHNHPSGVPEPSHADELITQRLRAALALVDVRVLDHLIVGGERCLSFAERGLL